jgi:Rrf2 family transcriptional regulator, cysteine metabolism repressor
MQLLTKETDYAVRSLLCVGLAPDGMATAKEIAEYEGISWLFLRRVMQRLAAVGLLSSNKGRCGGFTLGRPADKITLVDVITAFQGHIALTECLVRGLPCCNRPTCTVRRKLQNVEKMLKRELSGITIEELIALRRKEGGRRKRPFGSTR